MLHQIYRGVIMIITTYLYGEKSHSYKWTVQTGSAPAPEAPLLPIYLTHNAVCIHDHSIVLIGEHLAI